MPASAAAVESEELLAAAETGQVSRVSQLLSSGTSARSVDAVGHTALHKAAFMGFEALARLLLSHDPSCVNASDRRVGGKVR